MALMDRMREAWDNHKEDTDMQKRFAKPWEERPTDSEENTIRHLLRITQPTIDRFVSDQELDHIRDATPEQVNTLAGKIKAATGITETNAYAAIDLERNDYQNQLKAPPSEVAYVVPTEMAQPPAQSAPAGTSAAGQDSRQASDAEHLRWMVGDEHASAFVWKQDSGDIKSYQNQTTGNHVHFDSAGQFYNQDREPITRTKAIDHALHVPTQEHSSEVVTTPNLAHAQPSPVPTTEVSVAVSQSVPHEQAISM